MISLFELNDSECLILKSFAPVKNVSSSKDLYLILAHLSWFLSIIIVSMDITLIFLLVRCHLLHTKMNILRIMLAVPDLLTGGVILPLYGYILNKIYHDIVLCYLAYILDMFGFILSLMSFVVIMVTAVDVYIGTVKPFFHQENVTVRLLLVVIISAWIFMAIVTMLFMILFYRKWIIYQTFVGFLCLSMCFMIWISYKRVIDELCKIHSKCTTAVHTDRKMIVLICFIFSSIIVCYIPYIIMHLYMKIYGRTRQREEIVLIAQLIALTKPFWNAVINFGRLKSLKYFSRVIVFDRKVHPEQIAFYGQ